MSRHCNCYPDRFDRSSGAGRNHQGSNSLRKSVTIGIHNRVPWGYLDKDGKVAGLQPAIIRAALAPLGVTEVKFVIGEFSTMIPGLLAGRFDMTAAGVGITPARCKSVIFSEPDLTSGDGLLVASGNPLNLHSFLDVKNNPKVRLAGARGSGNAAHAIQAECPNPRCSSFRMLNLWFLRLSPNAWTPLLCQRLQSLPPCQIQT
ncbi:transporter substrate-binding domain-containing protein [Ochrobactrum oryzae]|nr:transporter substrate-binding domain-containing protein [Brucella oryzae]